MNMIYANVRERENTAIKALGGFLNAIPLNLSLRD
jgi:hypothetical protein